MIKTYTVTLSDGSTVTRTVAETYAPIVAIERHDTVMSERQHLLGCIDEVLGMEATLENLDMLAGFKRDLTALDKRNWAERTGDMTVLWFNDELSARRFARSARLEGFEVYAHRVLAQD